MSKNLSMCTDFYEFTMSNGYYLAGRKDEITFGCLRPEETELSHRLQTAALLSHRERRSVSLAEI